MLRPWQLERCEPQHSRWLGGFMIYLFVASLRDAAGGWHRGPRTAPLRGLAWAIVIASLRDAGGWHRGPRTAPLRGLAWAIVVASLRDAGGWAASRSQDCAPSGLGLGYCRCVPTGRRGRVGGIAVPGLRPFGAWPGLVALRPYGTPGGWVASGPRTAPLRGLAWAIVVASLRDAGDSQV